MNDTIPPPIPAPTDADLEAVEDEAAQPAPVPVEPSIDNVKTEDIGLDDEVVEELEAAKEMFRTPVGYQATLRECLHGFAEPEE